MVIKQVILDETGQQKLRSGIRKIAGAVKSTLGPEGDTVLLESEEVVGAYRITKDGVTVARSINLYDPIENLAVQIMKQASSQTATIAGDGTTSAIVLTEAILDAAEQFITEKHSKTKVIRELNKLTDEIIKDLTKRSVKVTGRRLLDVATVSANNDPVIGKMIADAYKKVKHVTVADSPSEETYSRVIEGIKIDRGYSSKYQITDESKEEAIIDNPFVLVSDIEVRNLMHLEGILKHVLQAGRPLLLIANLTPEALQALNLNLAKNKQMPRIVHIIPPAMGRRKTDLLRDLAVATGAVFFSEDTGDNMEAVTPDGLGEAVKIIASADQTVIIRADKPEINTAVDELTEQLKKQLEETTNNREREFTKERIANISGGVGVIYVGANSSIEQKEKFDRVDDAVRAVAAAIEEGVLPGGGVALFKTQAPYVGPSVESMVAESIIHQALKAPLKQILLNAGIEYSKVEDEIVQSFRTHGLNVKTGEYGDMIKMGIVDPAKVTKTALRNAVSVATTILSTKAVITNMRENAQAAE